MFLKGGEVYHLRLDPVLRGASLYRILHLEYRLPRFVTFPFPCRLPFPLSQVTASESEKSRIVPDQVAACFSVDLKHPQGAYLPVVSALFRVAPVKRSRQFNAYQEFD